MATTNPARLSAPSEVKQALLAYMDALTLAEPIQARLWHQAEITLTQLGVLRELRAGPQNAGRLGEKVGLSPASMSRLLDRLERRQLVSRHRTSEDRRVVEVHLDPEGEKLLGQLTVLRGSAVHRSMESMTPEERRLLTTSLRRLVTTARAMAAGEDAAE